MQNRNEYVKYLKVAVVVLFALYLFNCIKTLDDFHFISGVNLIIHESGHIIFFLFGQFISVLGGSLIQVLVPIVFAAYFFLRREIFSGSIILMWLGESIIDVARYAADAIAMQIPLLGGDSVIHDWNYLLTATHLLKYTDIIGGAIYYTGMAILVIGAVVGVVSALRKCTLSFA